MKPLPPDGGPNFTISSCWAISSGKTSRTSWRTSSVRASPSNSTGSLPTLSSDFPRSGTCVIATCIWNCEPRSSLGTSWEKSRGWAGAVRFVDSSLERLQVKVQGFVEGQHQLLCAGRVVPLRPTGVNGEAVAGVRYRAWQPPTCLHPNIKVHVPLEFDLVDTWSGRSLGGCLYRAAHPGGRNYETFPVNANEAEARRTARFSPLHLKAGAIPKVAPDFNADFPHTLDLRRC